MATLFLFKMDYFKNEFLVILMILIYEDGIRRIDGTGSQCRLPQCLKKLNFFFKSVFVVFLQSVNAQFVKVKPVAVLLPQGGAGRG